MCFTVYWKEKKSVIGSWSRPYDLDIKDWTFIFNHLYNRDNEYLEIFWECKLIFRAATYTGV